MEAIKRLLRAVTGLSLAILVAGCSKDITSVQTSGKVTFRGAALPGGTISFFPGTGRFVGAIINSDGTFAVNLPPGEYHVAVKESVALPENWQHGDPVPETKPVLPPKFANSKTSGLTAHIGSENQTQTVNFELNP